MGWLVFLKKRLIVAEVDVGTLAGSSMRKSEGEWQRWHYACPVTCA